MTEIINNQRKIMLDGRVFREFTENALRLNEEAENKTPPIAFEEKTEEQPPQQ